VPADELVGTALLDWIDPSDHDRVVATLTEVDSTARTVDCEMHRPDGSSMQAEVSVRDMRAHPSVAGLVLSVRNITERTTVADAPGEPIERGEQRAFAQASIGIAVAPPGVTPSTLLRNADVAMYRAKAAGKNRVEIFHAEMDREAGRRRDAERELRHAASAGQ